jgi:hypothetical protein
MNGRGANRLARIASVRSWVIAILVIAFLAACQGRGPDAPATQAATPDVAQPARATSAEPVRARTGGLGDEATPPVVSMASKGNRSAGDPAGTSSTSTPGPTMAPTSTATATPAPVPRARQLTSGGCCWNPFLLDGQVAFLDRPSAEAKTGFYAVPLAGGEPRLLEARIGFFLAGGAYFSYQEGGQTIVERRSDGQRWQLNTGGQPVILSPDGKQAAWAVRDWEGAYDQRRTQLWRGFVPGGPTAQVLSLYGGGLNAWLPGDRWLLTGRRAVSEPDRSLSVYDLATGQSRDLFHAQSFRSLSVSPDGAWVLLVVALDPQAERNGTWLIPVAGGEPRKLDWFGACAWRDSASLYYLPFQAQAVANEVWLYDVATNSSRRLTDPALTPFKVAQGNFLFVPEQRSLVYVSASDGNLWVLPLGE